MSSIIEIGQKWRLGKLADRASIDLNQDDIVVVKKLISGPRNDMVEAKLISENKNYPFSSVVSLVDIFLKECTLVD